MADDVKKDGEQTPPPAPQPPLTPTQERLLKTLAENPKAVDELIQRLENPKIVD